MRNRAKNEVENGLKCENWQSIRKIENKSESIERVGASALRVYLAVTWLTVYRELKITPEHIGFKLIGAGT